MKRRNALYGLMVFIMGLTLIFAGACTKSATVKDVGAEQQAGAEGISSRRSEVDVRRARKSRLRVEP